MIMTGTLQVRVSKVGLRVYPEVYVVAIDVTGAYLFGDLIPYGEDRFYELGAGWWTIRARNEVTGEKQEKDIEILEGQTTSVEFTFGIVPEAQAPSISGVALILGSVVAGLTLTLFGGL